MLGLSVLFALWMCTMKLSNGEQIQRNKHKNNTGWLFPCLFLENKPLTVLKSEPNQYICWPISSANVGSSQMYQCQRICPMCADMKTLFFSQNIRRKKAIWVIYKMQKNVCLWTYSTTTLANMSRLEFYFSLILVSPSAPEIQYRSIHLQNPLLWTA